MRQKIVCSYHFAIRIFQKLSWPLSIHKLHHFIFQQQWPLTSRFFNYIEPPVERHVKSSYITKNRAGSIRHKSSNPSKFSINSITYFFTCSKSTPHFLTVRFFRLSFFRIVSLEPHVPKHRFRVPTLLSFTPCFRSIDTVATNTISHYSLFTPERRLLKLHTFYTAPSVSCHHLFSFPYPHANLPYPWKNCPNNLNSL